MASLDAVGMVFGGGLRGARCTTGVPLALGTLYMKQLFGGYPKGGGKLLHGLWVSSSAKGLQPLDGGVCHPSELTELPLSEASSRTMRSKTWQWCASGPLHHPYSLCVVGISFTNEVPKRAEAAYPQRTRR